ncbi:MAG: GGDEF domain-containing protein [Hyphomonadaceae bacterium]|nr:GGDEF domain-containing protein [Clostridia bacterium]
MKSQNWIEWQVISAYKAMYMVMLLALMVYILFALIIQRTKVKNVPLIRLVIVSDATLLLLWDVAMTLMEQNSYGQIISYVSGVIFVALAVFVEPIIMLFILAVMQGTFMIALPYFQPSNSIASSHILNTTIAVIGAWLISRVFFKHQLRDFQHCLVIKEKNELLSKNMLQLEQLNDRLHEANSTLEELSYRDELSGLSNVRYFRKVLETEWERAILHKLPMTLLMLDIDFFKRYNDNYGHLSGDACIRMIANALTMCIDQSVDVFARYGGEEFVILLPNKTSEEGKRVANIVRQRIDDLKITHEHSLISNHVTISIGMSTITPTKENAVEQFIGVVDKALYKAKAAGRNKVAFLTYNENN